MKTLKIGVIGTGHMGRNHVRNLAEERRFELVGIYDADQRQANDIANKYGVRAFDSMDELLDSVEAVVIAVPSSLHRQIALQAAEHNVHALVEKPLATTSADAEVIAKAFQNRNLKCMVGHIERFNPVFRELNKLVDQSDIFYIQANRYSPFSGSGRIVDTSVVEDLMIHDVDLVCSLMKKQMPTTLYGRGESVRSRRIDFATCLMDFGGMAHAVVNASRISQDKERMITVHTADSCICADLLAKTLTISRSTNLTVDLSRENSYVQDGLVQKIYVPIVEPLRAELIAFYEAVENNAPIAVDAWTGVNAIRICEEVANQAGCNGGKSV